MANQSSTAFGLRPLRNVGQADHNAGLGEWMKASGSAAIYHHELTAMQATGYVISAGAGGGTLVGSLNGSFYTDPTTSKPTWSNYAPNVITALPYTALVNDDPHQMFEMRTALTNYTDPGTVGATAPIVDSAGSGAPNYISGFTIGAVTTALNQVKLLGISRDTLNQDVSVSGGVWRVMICSHILGSNSIGI